jgi:hypothetical protein
MGGSITSKSIEFINKLYKNKLLHRIETRNIEIKLSNRIIKKLDEIIPKVFKFELEWLECRLTINKKNKFIYRNNFYRIDEMQNRLKSEL